MGKSSKLVVYQRGVFCSLFLCYIATDMCLTLSHRPFGLVFESKASECKCPSKVVLLWDFVGSWEWHDTDTGFQQKIEISLQLFHFLEYVWTLHQQLTTQLLFHITMTWIWLAIVWSYLLSAVSHQAASAFLSRSLSDDITTAMQQVSICIIGFVKNIASLRCV